MLQSIPTLSQTSAHTLGQTQTQLQLQPNPGHMQLHVPLPTPVAHGNEMTEASIESISQNISQNSRMTVIPALPFSHTLPFNGSAHFMSPQQLVIIPKAADRRHSFQANENASSNPGRDKGRKYPPNSSSTSTSSTNSFHPNFPLPFSHNIGGNNLNNRTNYLSYVPYKFDPLFVEDPLNPGNNVGRNCFRVLQVQRCWSDVYRVMTQQLRVSQRDGVYYPVLEYLVGKIDQTFLDNT